MPADPHSILVFIAKLMMGGAFVVFGIRNVENITLLTGMLEDQNIPQARGADPCRHRHRDRRRRPCGAQPLGVGGRGRASLSS